MHCIRKICLVPEQFEKFFTCQILTLMTLKPVHTCRISITFEEQALKFPSPPTILHTAGGVHNARWSRSGTFRHQLSATVGQTPCQMKWGHYAQLIHFDLLCVPVRCAYWPEWRDQWEFYASISSPSLHDHANLCHFGPTSTMQRQ